MQKTISAVSTSATAHQPTARPATANMNAPARGPFEEMIAKFAQYAPRPGTHTQMGLVCILAGGYFAVTGETPGLQMKGIQLMLAGISAVFLAQLHLQLAGRR